MTVGRRRACHRGMLVVAHIPATHCRLTLAASLPAPALFGLRAGLTACVTVYRQQVYPSTIGRHALAVVAILCREPMASLSAGISPAMLLDLAALSSSLNLSTRSAALSFWWHALHHQTVMVGPAFAPRVEHQLTRP